ncbi:MAG: hypothetical protein ACKOD5_03520 [Chthoniobacterales bacterium]
MGIRCASCGYDNDPTRVYCHSCGKKLERGSVVAAPPTGFTHPTDAAKMRRPRAALPWGKYFAFLLKLCILGALIGAIVLALLPPHNLPAPVTGDDDLAQRLSGLVSDASQADSARSFAVPASDLQRWLVAMVKFQGTTGVLALDPRRVYVVPSNGRFRLGLELGLPAEKAVFMEAEYVPVRDGNGYTLQPAKYCIGRLPLPAFLGYPVERQFDGLKEALAVPLAPLAKASFIEVAPETVSLRWSGTQNP